MQNEADVIELANRMENHGKDDLRVRLKEQNIKVRLLAKEMEYDKEITYRWFEPYEDICTGRKLQFFLYTSGYWEKAEMCTDAFEKLKEYLIKGFALNDELLKNAGGGNYFDELLSRIRDIRSSEKIFYRKVLEIYALSIDYDPRTEVTKQFFATVQNKMHYSVHGHTAAEVIYNRADAEKDFMGLTTWTGMLPKKTDAEYAKNYLTEEELDILNRIVNLFLDFAELQAKSHTPMYMKDWVQKLDDFLKLSGKELLNHAGTISAEVAKLKANAEYDKFKARSLERLSPVEIHFIENFEKERKRLKK